MPAPDQPQNTTRPEGEGAVAGKDCQANFGGCNLKDERALGKHDEGATPALPHLVVVGHTPEAGSSPSHAKAAPEQSGVHPNVAAVVKDIGLGIADEAVNHRLELLRDAAVGAGLAVGATLFAPGLVFGLTVAGVGVAAFGLARSAPKWCHAARVVANSNYYSAKEQQAAHQELRGLGADTVQFGAGLAGGGIGGFGLKIVAGTAAAEVGVAAGAASSGEAGEVTAAGKAVDTAVEGHSGASDLSPTAAPAQGESAAAAHNNGNGGEGTGSGGTDGTKSASAESEKGIGGGGNGSRLTRESFEKALWAHDDYLYRAPFSYAVAHFTDKAVITQLIPYMASQYGDSAAQEFMQRAFQVDNFASGTRELWQRAFIDYFGKTPDAVLSGAEVSAAPSLISAGAQIEPGAIIAPGAVIDDGAIVSSGASIGPGVKVGAGSTVEPGVTIMEDTTIGRGVSVGRGTMVGKNVTLGDGVQIGSGARLGDDSSIGNFSIVGHDTQVGSHVTTDDAARLSGPEATKDGSHWPTAQRETFAKTPVTGNKKLSFYQEHLGVTDEELNDPQANILDLGSGKYPLSQEARQLGLPARIYSVNPQIGANVQSGLVGDDVKTAIANADSRTVAATSDALPFPDGTFRAVYASYSVPYYLNTAADIDQTMTEMVRVLEPGGTARVYPISDSSYNAVSKALERLGVNFTLTLEPGSDRVWLLTATKPAN